MTIQYIIIAVAVVACLWYAVKTIIKTVREARRCRQNQCSGCPFAEKCKEKDKKSAQKFGHNK